MLLGFIFKQNPDASSWHQLPTIKVATVTIVLLKASINATFISMLRYIKPPLKAK